MSLLIACAVLDTKVGAYAPPFFVRSKAEAIRSFLDACKDPQVSISKHPEDYRLFLVGSFDDLTGHLDPSLPEVLCQGE